MLIRISNEKRDLKRRIMYDEIKERVERFRFFSACQATVRRTIHG